MTRYAHIDTYKYFTVFYSCSLLIELYRTNRNRGIVAGNTAGEDRVPRRAERELEDEGGRTTIDAGKPLEEVEKKLVTPVVGLKPKFPQGFRRPVKASPKVLETVDFRAATGFLWQPQAMNGLQCPAGEGTECDATVTYCLISIGAYQENPWKFPMAAMLQKKSECSKPERSRAYRLSTLRVRERKRKRKAARGGSGGGGRLRRSLALLRLGEVVLFSDSFFWGDHRPNKASAVLLCVTLYILASTNRQHEPFCCCCPASANYVCFRRRGRPTDTHLGIDLFPAHKTESLWVSLDHNKTMTEKIVFYL